MKISETGKATLSYDGNEVELPLLEGTMGEKAIDISKLRGGTGLVTLDNGYGEYRFLRLRYHFHQWGRGRLTLSGLSHRAIG